VAILVATLVGVKAASLVGVRLVSISLEWTKKEKTGPSLILPPGANLRAVRHFLHPTNTAETAFDQLILYMQEEWQEAIMDSQQGLARWVHVRGVLTIFLTAAVHVVATLGSILKLVR